MIFKDTETTGSDYCHKADISRYLSVHLFCLIYNKQTFIVEPDTLSTACLMRKFRIEKNNYPNVLSPTFSQ